MIIKYGDFPVELNSKTNLLIARQDNVGSKFVCQRFRYDFDVCYVLAVRFLHIT
jgi:hypothetical protein